MKGGRLLCWDKKEERDGGEWLEPNLRTRDRKENDDVRLWVVGSSPTRVTFSVRLLFAVLVLTCLTAGKL